MPRITPSVTIQTIDHQFPWDKEETPTASQLLTMHPENLSRLGGVMSSFDQIPTELLATHTTEVFRACQIGRKPGGQPDTWRAKQLITVACQLKLIEGNSTAEACLLAKDRRYLIHPGAVLEERFPVRPGNRPNLRGGDLERDP